MGIKLIHMVVGARPNFVKAAPILSAFAKALPEFEVALVHTGQHYDYNMSRVFFEQFGISEPDFHLGIGSAPHGAQTGRVLEALESLFMDTKPNLIMVLGDVNSTLAAALAAVKLHLPVAHVEAGLRSFDMKMPEEVNRILTDRISEILFTTEKSGIENLISEGIPEKRIYLVGNVMIDNLAKFINRMDESTVLDELDLKTNDYSVLTLHRPGNVDSRDGILKALEVIKLVSDSGKLIFPIHPRTSRNFKDLDMEDRLYSISNLQVIDPVGYFDFMKLVSKSRFVMTDSGGIQSEAAYMAVPCITLRESTEHVLTVESGINTLTGMDIKNVKYAIQNALEFEKSEYHIPDILDGRASMRIVEVIRNYFE